MAGTPNTANIFVGAPDRLTSGAILVAPAGTAVPTDIVTAPNVALKDLGYISEDGLSIAQSSTWETIRDWGGDQVRKFLSDFTGTLNFAMLETNTNVLKFVYGSANVTTIAPPVLRKSRRSIRRSRSVAIARASRRAGCSCACRSGT